MNYNDFYDDIMKNAEMRPRYIRYGQAVFNYIDETYGVARYVQFEKHIDCFYDDSQVEDFIKCSWDIYQMMMGK